MDAFVEGSKRQLPSWMMPPKVGASNASNSGDVVETSCSKENEDIIAANVKKNDRKKETLKRKLNSNAKCEVMGKINLDQQNESDDNIAEKKKKKVNSSRGRAPRRSTKKRENLEDHSCGSSESDDNIAEKKKKRVNSSMGRAPRRSTKKRGSLEDHSRGSSESDDNIAEKKKKRVNSSMGRAPRRSTKKRGSLEDHSHGSSESDDNIAEKKKKKVNSSRGSAPRRSTKKRENLEDHSRSSSSDCDHVCPVQAASDDDDMELTVEDLMAIAEQYVKDSEDNEPQETTSRRCEPKWQFPAITEVGTTLDSSCENKKSSTMEREALYNSAPSPTTGEVIPTSTSQIGHPAQDMLDVFLGPLLRNL